MRTPEQNQKGVNLIELMIAVAIIGIVSAVALPMYSSYSEDARIGAINDNMTSIILFEEERRLSSGSYEDGEYDPDDPDDAAGLKTVIGWDPRGSTGGIKYIVTASSSSGFVISAEDAYGTVMLTKTHCRNGTIADGSCR